MVAQRSYMRVQWGPGTASKAICEDTPIQIAAFSDQLKQCVCRQVLIEKKKMYLKKK